MRSVVRQKLLFFGPALGLWLFIVLCGVSGAKEHPDSFPDFTASAYLLKTEGEVVWERNPDRALPPASLTKIMTALLVIKRANLDDIAIVRGDAARETGTRLGLRTGERMYVGFLLAATLLGSANDACHVLADHISGSEAEFTNLMNREARALGMRNTRFTNACGHDQPGHYSSARDLALLTEAGLAEPVFSELAATVFLNISTVGGGRVFRLENKNALIGRYPGARGVKTGFTAGAGKCVIALAERNGMRVLLVVLNAPDCWWGAVEMLDAAFARVERASRVPRP